VLGPTNGEDWLGLTSDLLVAETALAWATRPDCGAVVLFSGTVRDHAEGRPGVVELVYEAYDEQVVARLARIAAEARTRWPDLRRIVAWHRTGALAVGDISVLVVVSSPHRGDAFEAGRHIIDTLKRTVPIWKRETWAGGQDWGTDAAPIGEVAR